MEVNDITTQQNQDLAVSAPGKSFSLSPKTLDEAMKFSDMIAHSGMVPKDYIAKPGAVLVAVQMGAEVGLQPMQALQNIAVINGRPTVWGDAALAIIKAHPHFEYIKEDVNENGTAARCRIKRKGEDEVVRLFTIEDAQQAGLWGKTGPWSTYPKRMLQMRARGFAIRDAFPDALRGLSIREEVEDIQTEQTPDGTYQQKVDPEQEFRGTVNHYRSIIKGAPNAAVLRSLHSDAIDAVRAQAAELEISDSLLSDALIAINAAKDKQAERFAGSQQPSYTNAPIDAEYTEGE